MSQRFVGQGTRAGAALALMGALLSAAAFALLASPTPRAPDGRPAASATTPAASSPRATAESDTAPRASRLRRIDIHTHLDPRVWPVAQKLLDEGEIDLVVNLTGAPSGPALDAYLALERASKGRVLTFAGVDWRQLRQESFGERMADDLERAVKQGARGLKIPKALGLAVPAPEGGLLAIDDPRLDPLFDRAGALGIPVAIHVADPVAFWQPVDEGNERYQELSRNPGWSYHGRPVPSHAELLAQAKRRYARHPKTTFVAVHVAGNPEDLAYVSTLLRELPNLYVDIAARVPELGRHSPEVGRAFFLEHQDRVLFGTDLGVGPEGIMLGAPLAWRETWEDVERFFSSTKRYLETSERQFEHPTPIQGAWKIDGVGLPAEVLRKLYVENAARLLGLSP